MNPPKKYKINPKNLESTSIDNLKSKKIIKRNKQTNLTNLTYSRDKLLIKNKNIIINKKNKSISSKKKKETKIGKILLNRNIPEIKNKSKKMNSNKKLTDTELNQLEYEKAIIFDHRTYFQYYKSLIFAKQLVLFTFFRKNDYNLVYLKICLFFFSFSLSLTINGFFFNDESMNKIYQDNGKYNLLFQIPQILYSLFISSLITILLKTLSLTEKIFLSLKQEKKNTIEEAAKLKKLLKIRIFLFFMIGITFMAFFWYFISCFCAVYKNTQLILIFDSLFSFGFSLIYPFGFNLFPGMFRISALRAKRKNKKCIFKISTMLALI
jgi:hypothetical protein